MWLFTKIGFLSVSCKPDGMHIRARNRQHLVALRSRFPCIKTKPILATPDHDYSFRMIVSRQEWIQIASGLAEEIDYSNFKHEADKTADQPYVDALYEIWSRMVRYQAALRHPDVGKARKVAQNVPESQHGASDEEVPW